MRKVLLVGGVLVAGVAVSADKPRTFTGSLQVPPDRRPAVLKLLKDKGLTDAYVPETAAPETVMYRGPKADYDVAHDAVQRYLHPEWYSDRPQQKSAPDRRPAEATDELKRLGVSPLQKELLEAVMKESDKRRVEFRPGPGGPTEEQKKKGAEFNGWWRGQWKAILTREQYTQWAGPAAARDLGPEPKVPALDPKAAKSDDAILARLGLSEKQHDHLSAVRKRIAAAKPADADGRRKLDAEWRVALAHALTDAQLREYRTYWDGR